MAIFQSLVPFLFILLFQNYGWTYQFNKEGIVVSTRDVPGSEFHAFKGVATFPHSAESIASIIQDVADYPAWCYQTSATNIFRKEKNRIYYRAVTLTPPLIKHREVYSCTERIQGSVPGEIILLIKSFESAEPIPEGFVRMAYSNGSWRLVPLSAKSTLVEFEMEANPGGFIPAWLANRASVDAPYHTMKNLLKMLEKAH